MDAQSLEKIIGLFAQLGVEAKWAFIAYLALEAFKVVAVSGTMLALAAMIIRAFRAFSDETRAWNAIRSLFDAKWNEYDRVIRGITSLVDKK